MAKSPRSIPAQYPQPLASIVLKAEIYRQASILRQEIAADLLSIASESKEPVVRAKLIRLVETNLASGVAATRKCEELWPEAAEAERIIAEKCPKPASANRNMALFRKFDDLQRKSMRLLQDSFKNIRLIIDRMQPSDQKANKPTTFA
jgi:hypothetical protein